MLRVAHLHELVRALSWHPCHAEDARELVHVEWLAAHAFHLQLARVELRADVHDALDRERRRRHVVDLKAPVRADTHPVDMDGHRGTGAQVSKLLPPFFHPVALAGGLLFEEHLQLLTLTALATKVSDDALSVCPFLLAEERLHRLQVALERVRQLRQGQWRQLRLMREQAVG